MIINKICNKNLEFFYCFKDASIGPGTYYNEKLASSIKVQTKPLELQNFGSSSLRFEQNANLNKVLGPGKYDPKFNPEFNVFNFIK